MTLSTKQLAFAKNRMQRLGVPDAGDAASPGLGDSETPKGAQYDLRLQDYRDINDALFERHVGATDFRARAAGRAMLFDLEIPLLLQGLQGRARAV